MNPKNYYSKPISGQFLWVAALVLSVPCFIIALNPPHLVLFPVFPLSFFWMIDCSIQSFTDEFRGAKNPALVRRMVFGPIQIFTGFAIVAFAIIGGGIIVLMWCAVAVIFLYCGSKNVAAAVPLWQENSSLRANEREIAAKSAIVEAFKQMEIADKERKVADKKEIEDSLLKSLAFLTDIDPKHK